MARHPKIKISDQFDKKYQAQNDEEVSEKTNEPEVLQKADSGYHDQEQVKKMESDYLGHPKFAKFKQGVK